MADRIGEYLTRNSGWFIAAVLLLTVLFALPIVLMAPPGPASLDPGGPVFELQRTVNHRFPPRLHITSFIIEDKEGDILRQKPLWELYQNEGKLRAGELGRFLYTGYDADNQRRILGVFTMADAVQTLLLLEREGGATLETATDRQVKEAVGRVLESPLGRPLRAALSRDASFQIETIGGKEIKLWRAAALSAFVASDNSMLGGGPLTLSLSGDQVTLGKERFNRQVQRILRGEESAYRLWGIAIDVNLVSQEQGKTAIPFIAATVVVVLLVVGVTLRSLGVVGLAFLGLLMLLVWLKGLSNLAGLKSSLTLDLLVPIAMISLGVDFLIHSVARYREESRRLAAPAPALRAGFAGVLGALTLAMLTDGIAFVANVTSGIETVIGFGIAAGIAVLASYIVMGMFLPLVIMRLDQRRLRLARTGGEYPRGDRMATGSANGSQVQAGRGRADEAGGQGPATPQRSNAVAGTPPPTGAAWLVIASARRRWLVLPATAAVTVAAVWLAFQLEPGLDVKDFFDSNSDLVVGLDKLEQHTAPAISGEPGIIYIQGDLAAPESLAALRGLLARLNQNDSVGRAADGQVFFYSRTPFQLLSRVSGNEYARSQVLATTGVSITDADSDRVPDGPAQVRAAYDYMVRYGVPLDKDTLFYDALQVRETLYHRPGDGAEQAIILVAGVLGSRQQSNIGAARQALERDLAPLREVPTISFVGITGSPFTREATLRATTRALNISLPVAVAACFILLAIWMRSLSLAAVTIIPIGLVDSWLYAFMYLAGFHLNFVTATIAAVSIGVGVDYSIYLTQRFRQELGRGLGPEDALGAAAAGTGVALAGSAASSVVGFAVMSFAPMPLFSAYGIITAAMVLMAAVASLVVLPPLLMLVTRPK